MKEQQIACRKECFWCAYNWSCVVVQLRREKVELENALEQEQESLVNRLWKRMDKLEAEKRSVHIGWKCFFLSFSVFSQK